MAPSKRTIVLLSAKRTGSTAVFRMFQSHPEVGVCHVDATIGNWEPNFWNLAAKAIAGEPEGLIDRFRQSHPFLDIRPPIDREQAFALWDEILDRQGPIVFDKSPQYLGSPAGLDLLREYRARGNDVRVFGLIRDGRDAISSQFTHWAKFVDGDSPQRRERHWLQIYGRLEEIVEHGHLGPIPVFRYEDFAAAPSCYAPMIFRHAGIAHVPETYAHVRPVSVGRHLQGGRRELRQWKISDEMRAHLMRYGYAERPNSPTALGARVKRRLARTLRRLRPG